MKNEGSFFVIGFAVGAVLITILSVVVDDDTYSIAVKDGQFILNQKVYTVTLDSTKSNQLFWSK